MHSAPVSRIKIDVPDVREGTFLGTFVLPLSSSDEPLSFRAPRVRSRQTFSRRIILRGMRENCKGSPCLTGG